MFRFRFYVCLFAFFLATIFSVSYSSGTENFPDERDKIRKVWLDATRTVVHRIRDQQANKIFQFVEKNSILGIPNEKGVLVAEDAKSANWFIIIPLREEDKKINQEWAMIFEASLVGCFVKEIRSLVLMDYIPFSSNIKAIVLLHEGYHAKIFCENPYEEQSDYEYCLEEVRVCTFQNRVMSLIGGKKYQAILNKEVKRIASLANVSKGSFSVPSRTEYNKELAKVFGKPASQIEKDFVQTSVWIHAVFTFLEKKFKKESLKQKVFFLKKIYEEGGIL